MAGCGEHRSTAPAKPTLRPIREDFTVLACPRSERERATTLGMEGCREHEVLRTDAQIYAQERAIVAALGPRGRRSFVRAERSWLAYRKGGCEAEASRYAGGTIEPVVFIDCVAARNRQHLAELRALRRR